MLQPDHCAYITEHVLYLQPIHAATVSEHASTPMHVQIHSCDYFNYFVGLWNWMGGWAGMLQLLHKPQVNENKASDSSCM